MSETVSNVQTRSPSSLFRPRRRRWLTVLLAMILLVSGGIIGSGVTIFVVHRVILHRLHHPEEFPAIAANRLRRHLDLTDEQTQSAETIFRNRLAAVHDIRREFHPQLKAEFDLIQKEIGGILNPEQAELWNSHFDKLRETWMPTTPQPAGED